MAINPIATNLGLLQTAAAPAAGATSQPQQTPEEAAVLALSNAFQSAGSPSTSDPLLDSLLSGSTDGTSGDALLGGLLGGSSSLQGTASSGDPVLDDLLSEGSASSSSSEDSLLAMLDANMPTTPGQSFPDQQATAAYNTAIQQGNAA